MKEKRRNIQEDFVFMTKEHDIMKKKIFLRRRYLSMKKILF